MQSPLPICFLWVAHKHRTLRVVSSFTLQWYKEQHADLWVHKVRKTLILSFALLFEKVIASRFEIKW